MKTRAAILTNFNEPLTFDEIDVADPKQGEVLVRMVASGVCHTDLSAIKGLLPIPVPMVLGHEGAGIVEAVGPGVTRFAKGDHVVTSAVAHCRNCGPCLSGTPYFCSTSMDLGFGGNLADGTKRFRRGKEEIGHFFLQSSFAEYAVAPEQIVVKVPDELPLEQLGPLACGISTGAGAVMNIGDVHTGQSVAVIGCGAVGLSAIMAARVRKASTIIAVDLLDSRLKLARDLGATETINAKGTNVVEEIVKLTGGGGVDFGFECIGRADTIRQAVDCTRQGGDAVISGVVPAGSEVSLDGLGLLMKNIRANPEGGSIPQLFIPLLLDLWRKGDFPFDQLLGATYAHSDLMKALDAIDSGAVIKPVVVYDR